MQLLDLVDYPTYMVAMNALPPVPALVGDGWPEARQARVDGLEPWLVRWVEGSTTRRTGDTGHLRTVVPMARWWDRWLRPERLSAAEIAGYDGEPALTWFAKRSTRPAPGRTVVDGEWRSAPVR